jgi:biotin carboxyl carrier protein
LIVRVEVGGRSRVVDITRAATGFAVVLDGRSVEADLAPSPSGCSLLLDGRSYDVALDEQPAGTTVYVNGYAIPVRLRVSARRGVRSRGELDADEKGPRQIVSPMPGRVVKILVNVGDAIEKGQGLLIVEAMKMENELRAPGSGSVREVRVAEGERVEAKAVLIVIA